MLEWKCVFSGHIFVAELISHRRTDFADFVPAQLQPTVYVGFFLQQVNNINKPGSNVVVFRSCEQFECWRVS